MLDYALIHGPVWNELSRQSRDVYEQIKSSRHTRDKKGRVVNTDDKHIRFGYSDLKVVMARSTYYKSVRELCSKGLIEIIDSGDFPHVDDNGEIHLRRKAIYSLSNKWWLYNNAETNRAKRDKEG
jgi:hypothetical protein